MVPEQEPGKKRAPKREPAPAPGAVQPERWDEMSEAERWAELDRLMNLTHRANPVAYAKGTEYRLRFEDGSENDIGRGDGRVHGRNDH